AEAAGDGAGPRIREVIETTRGQAVRRVHLRVQTRVAGEEDEVVRRDVQPGAARRTRQQRQIQVISEGDVLQAHERRILDPARREDRRLVNPGRIAQGRPQEVLVL